MSFALLARTSTALLAVATISGCYSPEKAPPERSAIDQQVTSEAIRAAVENLYLEPLAWQRGPEYEVVVSGAKDPEAQWVRSCLERRLLRLGLDVVRGYGVASSATPISEIAPIGSDREPERPRRILEAVVAYASNDLEQSLIGVPLFVPGLPVTLGNVSLFSSSETIGRARLGCVIWERARLIDQVAEVQESRYYKNVTFLTFIGPFQSTDMEEYRSPGEERNRNEP